ncbi:MAG: four helix bundle protein [Clostridia bacterium]|nr:four helix bundle protein [Clostridia bacterium]
MGNLIEDRSFEFAVRIVKLNKYLNEQKKEFVLSKQILRSGTSIGANVAEAQQGQSDADFVSKMNIALKEAAETKYWLRLLEATEYLTANETKSILAECIELEKILYSIIRTSKSKQ